MNTVEHTQGPGVDVGGVSDEREAALTELRKRLDDALADAGLTKVQLAARTGRSRTTVQEAFQDGGRVPSAATVALAGKLGLSAKQKRELLQLRRAAADETDPVRVRDEGLGKPIEQWDPHDLEVHPAGTPTTAAGTGARALRALPGYVRRAHDRTLTDAVAEVAEGRSRMLVLVGSSSTGKTRACWEAVQPLAAKGWRLWHPYDSTRAEAALADLNRVAPRTVVWLNEAPNSLPLPVFLDGVQLAEIEEVGYLLHDLQRTGDSRCPEGVEEPAGGMPETVVHHASETIRAVHGPVAHPGKSAGACATNAPLKGVLTVHVLPRPAAAPGHERAGSRAFAEAMLPKRVGPDPCAGRRRQHCGCR